MAPNRFASIAAGPARGRDAVRAARSGGRPAGCAPGLRAEAAAGARP